MTDILIIDTNILVRYALNDNARQALIAHNYLNNLKYQCVISMQTFCELDWVLRNTAKIPRQEVIEFFVDLSSRPNMIFDKSEFEVGLYFLKNGGDFADGIIFCQSQKFDNAKVLSFDKKAQKLATRLNINLEVL